MHSFKNLMFFTLVFILGKSFAFAQMEQKVWGQNLYIEENIYDQDNRYLRLNDGSFWLLNYTYSSFWDRFSGKDVQSAWLAPQQVEIKYSSNHEYPYLMTNLYSKEKVEARQINPKLLMYTSLERIRHAVQSGFSGISGSLEKLEKTKNTHPAQGQH